MPLPEFELRFVCSEYRSTVTVLTTLAPGSYTLKVMKNKHKKSERNQRYVQTFNRKLRTEDTIWLVKASMRDLKLLTEILEAV